MSASAQTFFFFFFNDVAQQAKGQAVRHVHDPRGETMNNGEYVSLQTEAYNGLGEDFFCFEQHVPFSRNAQYVIQDHLRCLKGTVRAQIRTALFPTVSV